MVAALIPYIITMMLGRTLDLTSYSVGPYISGNQNVTKKNLGELESKYRVIQDAEDFYNLLQIPVDLVLKSRLNQVKIQQGSLDFNDLITSRRWHGSHCLVALIVRYKTGEEALTEALAPDAERKSKIMGFNSSHYAKRALRGEQVIVLYRMTSEYPGDISIIKRTVQNILGVSGEIDSSLAERWKRVKAAVNSVYLRGNFQMDAQMFSSLPLNENLFNPEGLLELFRRLPREAEQRIGPSPVQLFELSPLAEFDKDFPRPTMDTSHFRELLVLDRQYDDIRATKDDLDAWLEDVDDIPEEEGAKMAQLLNRLTSLLETYAGILSQASLYAPFNMTAYQDAQKAYKQYLPYKNATYYLQFLRLKETSSNECTDKFNPPVKGYLRLSDSEVLWEGHVKTIGEEEGGSYGAEKHAVTVCQEKCQNEPLCRGFIFGKNLALENRETGLWRQVDNRCWIIARSTKTAEFEDDPQIKGLTEIFDRVCY